MPSEETTIQSEELIAALGQRIGQLEIENTLLRMALEKQEQMSTALRTAIEMMGSQSDGNDGD